MLARKVYTPYISYSTYLNKLDAQSSHSISLLNKASEIELEQIYYTLLATRPERHDRPECTDMVKWASKHPDRHNRWNELHWYRIVSTDNPKRIKVILSSNQYNYTWKELYAIIIPKLNAIKLINTKKRSY